MNRHLPVVTAVLGLHALALWALDSGLLRTAGPVVVLPARLLTEPLAPPAAPVAPPVPVTQARPSPTTQASNQAQPQTRASAQPTLPTPTMAPTPATVPHPNPAAPPLALPGASAHIAATASAANDAAQPARVELAGSSAGAAIASATAAAAAAIELPSGSADDFDNPIPPYPALSRRLGEQGRVLVRALVQTDGTAARAEIYRSSGHARLDQSALKTVLTWRFRPGQRAGVPETMWVVVPIRFVLE
ncbi:TonB family protein [Hydrogenophaga sp.]|uniref:energy transducer TonB n=1 Tax=Hydrogenophaga sp. TaxID=1904254 RepID=UPI0019838E6C|nr:TonB family protein [Hydrogenophaga sp.]MBD3892770.1 energy transducer TonB [Hydrogenophaga sp.]